MSSLIQGMGIKPDYQSENLKVWPNHFTSESGAKLVRAHLRKDLPKRTGLTPERIIIGHFTFKFWGLRDDYGYFATTESLKPLSVL